MNINGWYETDNDCMQHCKEMEDRVYQFVQVRWLDTTSGDQHAENACDEFDNYIVVADTINMKEYTEEDIEDAICGYYPSIKAMEESYEMSVEELDQAIAECAFENQCSYEYQSEIVSLKDAEKIIEEYLTNH